MAPKRISVQKTCAPERTGPTVVLATNPRAKAGSDDIAAMLCCSKGNMVTFPQHGSLVSLPNCPSCASRLRSRSIATLPRSLASNTLYPPRFHSCPDRGTRAHPAAIAAPLPGRALCPQKYRYGGGERLAQEHAGDDQWQRRTTDVEERQRRHLPTIAGMD